mmetsp:Transcript_16380/g.35623  ORF Transcript_16380/g.35623 Transcript_16380/m.35623 type:complete len:310 (+) Transcript_16380:78-1007(+)|eukprot:CAMPEP_0172545210 /NCGR_PEP_ID=MMETSP1067-20121228/15182_1 /TAXON_ID=265564 ORGANISM="Thalassiosira punctigera, Strain Tpunct2005C2" /NCGR_SAMPLE_ID=MMETSP1067 /ASSEMBLY_ACC=CAM_ASM_000444 /LENGTH=309 /DNA_ID=CAMNT_0013331913 /DNA_START=13 /DNA_END=942 /DNA_ORIENTATION=+
MVSTAAVIAAIAPLASAFAPSNTPLAAARSSSSLGSYLDSLSGQQANHANPPAHQPPSPASTAESSTGFCHVPLEYFAFENLSSKGPRATYDWGAPQDWSRKLADDGVFRAGSWYCSEGGWASPNGKGVTEVFYMLEGHGMLGDADGAKHFFGPGDVVIIPKGHTGRWDVNGPIHKVWAVNAHDHIEEAGPIIRAQVDHYKDFAPHCLSDTSACDPLYGNTGCVSSASNTFYDVGPTKVGAWTCQPGSFEVACGERQWFHVVEGTMFVTDRSDGTSRRCVAGDTVMLPAAWSGYVDVVEPVKKVFTVAK